MVETRTITNRAEWLAWRRQDVTASVVGALFGVHPYSTALRLYVEKRGVEFPEQDDNKVMRRGRWLEPAIGKAVSELSPHWELESPGVYLRDPELQLGATPDFYIHGDPRGLGVLQAKSVAPSVFHRDWLNGDEPPLWITLQTLTEMMLSNAAFGIVAVLLVDPHQMDCTMLDIPRNEAAEAKIISAVRTFWTMVEQGREPAPDYGRDADVIKAMAPHEEPGKSVDLSSNNQLPELLETRARLMARIKEAEESCDRIENEIRFLMRDAETATGLNGWRITYKTGDRAGYTVPPKRLRVLRIHDRRPDNGNAP